jgi:sorting nexin-8
MSLFGSSPTQSPLANSSLNSKSLFGDEVTPAATSTSSLFADDNSDPSPWLMPTPKKAARRDLVKTLLQPTDVPESYVDAYDKTLALGDRVGAGIGLTEIKKILESSRLNPTVQAQVLNLVLPGGQESVSGLGRSEFNVLLALIGLDQEGEDVTLDGVDERRRSESSPLYLDVMCSEAAAGLPIPRIPYLDKVGSARSEQSNGTTSQMPNPSRPRNAQKDSSASRPRQIRQDSLGGDLESDPWGTPRVQKSVPQSTAAHNPQPNGVPDHGGKSTAASLPQRTTSTFTTHAESPSESNSQPIGGVSGGVAGWSSYNGSSNEGFSEQQNLIGGGFGDGSGSQGNPGSEGPRRSVGASTVLPHASGEVVTVTMLPEKEGIFMFQHRNYEVKSVRRSSSVVRRYSDFVWLLDCLQKRYPFRRLPLLPPKRVQGDSLLRHPWNVLTSVLVNGTHLAADATSFLEKRRRGLVRFANALVQHPVLNQEQLVVMFLTVPTVSSA